MSCIITGYLLYIYTYVHVSKLNDACSGSITAACHTSRGRFDRTEPFQVALSLNEGLYQQGQILPSW